MLELGFCELHAAGQSGFTGSGRSPRNAGRPADPAGGACPRPFPALQERIDALLEKNQQSGLAPDEQREWESLPIAEHLVRLAKARAALKLKAS